MNFICINFLCLIIFVHFGATLITKTDGTQTINDLRYPKPINFTNIFPFRVLRTIFNMTSLDQSIERGTNRITSQVSAVVDVLRRVLRYMLRNALAMSPLRANAESTTAKDLNGSKVMIDLPVFNVVNDTDITENVSSKNSTEELSNNV